MSWKSIWLSILAMILFAGMLFGVVYLFMFYWVLGIIGLVLLAIFPRKLFVKAKDEARGVFDTLFAKFIAPTLAAVLGLFFILTLFLWV